MYLKRTIILSRPRGIDLCTTYWGPMSHICMHTHFCTHTTQNEGLGEKPRTLGPRKSIGALVLLCMRAQYNLQNLLGTLQNLLGTFQNLFALKSSLVPGPQQKCLPRPQKNDALHPLPSLVLSNVCSFPHLILPQLGMGILWWLAFMIKLSFFQQEGRVALAKVDCDRESK